MQLRKYLWKIVSGADGIASIMNTERRLPSAATMHLHERLGCINSSSSDQVDEQNAPKDQLIQDCVPLLAFHMFEVSQFLNHQLSDLRRGSLGHLNDRVAS
jgi:hypothetical protein